MRQGKNDDFKFCYLSKQVAVPREVQSISDLHNVDSKSAFHDNNSNKDLSLNLERLNRKVPGSIPREEKEWSITSTKSSESLSRNFRVTGSNPREEKEWSICSTKSSESSDPTDEEIADLVQNKKPVVVNLRTKLSTKAVSDANFNAVKLKR